MSWFCVVGVPCVGGTKVNVAGFRVGMPWLGVDSVGVPWLGVATVPGTMVGGASV